MLIFVRVFPCGSVAKLICSTGRFLSPTELVETDSAEIFASNQVIGEAYIAVQHHYGVSKPDAKQGLVSVLRSGLVAPLNAAPVFEALQGTGGCGLFDRLIAEDYARSGSPSVRIDVAPLGDVV